MKICVVGTGYVGLVAGTCFSNLGNQVICVDVDEEKINGLKKGILPIYEPGLKELVNLNVQEGRLKFTTNIKEGVETSDVIFIAVGTPEGEDGSADLKYVFQVAEDIGKNMNGYKIVVDKSTVPVKTADSVKEIIEKSQKEKFDFDVVSNPEFLREGSAIKDFTSPDRVVLGMDSDRPKESMMKLYRNMERTGNPILITDVKSAELIKYASNAMLATRISFMNQLSHLCEKIGADIKLVAKGMGLDDRIGPRFLQAGVGYGGSCFPKDVQAIIRTLKEHDCDAEILDAVEAVNEKQKKHLTNKLKKYIPDFKGKKIALWGLAFKPKTDDMREAPAIVMINELQEAGAIVSAFDPIAEESAKKIFKNVSYCKTPYDVLDDADALLIVTEWDEFREPDFELIKKKMKNPLVLDGRNIFVPKDMKAMGFTYEGIGR